MAEAGGMFSLDTWKNWDKTGKAEVVQSIKQLLKENGDNPGLSLPGQSKDLSRALYELVGAVVRGHLRIDSAIPLLTDMMHWHSDMASQLVEVTALLDLETAAVERMSRNRDTLLSLLKFLDADRLLKERLEIETLGDAGIIRHKKIFHTKQIKVKTKLFYKQQKFNLLREETEGYAKLVTELNQDITERVTPDSMIQVIRSLIGGFNLDPNRVLDLILESLESRPHLHQFYMGLLSQYPCESATISEILGFKLNGSGRGRKETQGIYTTIALLVQAGILHLSDIYVWLGPDDNSMIEEYHKEEAEANEMAQRVNIVSTKDKDKEKEKEKEEEEKERQEQLRNMERYLDNQKIQLCIALLQVGAWEHFQEVSRRFPDYYLVSFLPISKALCTLLHSLIEPLYRRVCQLPNQLQGSPVEPLDNPRAPSPATKNSELIDTVFPMLSALGPHLCNDPGLMYKVLRIGRYALKGRGEVGTRGTGTENVKGAFYYEFLDILDEVLLPALSMLDANPCLAEEIWETLKMYPYQHRYKLYGRWKNETCNQHPILVRRRTALLKKAKFIMMRITKETIKPVSRGIGKLTHNNPGPIFEYILMQVQLYDNLIGPVVDSFKYLTSLSYDMLGYCMVEILSENKDRIANDAMAISTWLQSLSSFIGSVYKKYPIDLGGILQFVANQLKAEKSIDLLILREIVQKMGGTDTLEDLTAEQLDAMCGGELLRREAGQYLQERNTKRSSVRLKEALLEHELAVPLLLLIAQQRASVVFNQIESPHLKLVGKLYDQCQDTMVQFGSYLFQAVTIDELSARMPPIGTLLSEYHLSADVAFFLTRPHFINMINAKYDDMRKQDKGDKKVTPEQKKARYLEACVEVFGPVVNSIRPYISIRVFEDMDPSFFLTFWTLTMSDLEVPHHMYEKEIKKIDPNPCSCNKRKKEADRLLALKEKLQEEEKRQKEHVERVMARLEQEKRRWFTLRGARSPKTDTVTAFLQLCLFPRCTFTTLDAIYCAKFVKMLHDLKTPNFSTLICYDRMYCDITYTVASCTEQEAHRYARFLLGTLDTVMHWHASESNYERECATYPGFVTKYRVSRQEANDYVDYENYRHVVHKWHYKITKALITCVESGEYIQIRNAILILQGIIQRFPAIYNLASVIVKRIEKVKAQERNVRNDLYVLANSYSGRLKAIKPKLPQEPEFHIVIKRPHSHKGASAATESVSSGKDASGSRESARDGGGGSTGAGGGSGGGGGAEKDTKVGVTTETPPPKMEIKVEAPDTSYDEVEVKIEPVEVANGDVDVKVKEEREVWETDNTSKSSKEKRDAEKKGGGGGGGGGEEVEGKKNEEKKKEEKEKKKEKEKEEREEKSRKRSKESKKIKVEPEEYPDERDERERGERERDRDAKEREGSANSNASTASNKMDPPEASPRGSKRRKTEHSSKSRSAKEEGSSSSSRHKHKDRSKSREPESEAPLKESKREKKERKRDRLQEENFDADQKRRKVGSSEDRLKSNGRQDEEHRHKHRVEAEEYYERYSSKDSHRGDYEYEREYEKPATRHKRKN